MMGAVSDSPVAYQCREWVLDEKAKHGDVVVLAGSGCSDGGLYDV